MTPTVLAVELFTFRADGTCRWWPSLHHGNLIDATVIESQVRAAQQNNSREW
jgi:hypothetical protein